MIKIAPSLLSADFSTLNTEIKRVKDAGAKYLHLDVMDGAFVPNITFGPELISCIRKCTDMFFDVHLMIKRPERYIDRFVKAGADSITVHYEACENPMSVINLIRSYNGEFTHVFFCEIASVVIIIHRYGLLFFSMG